MLHAKQPEICVCVLHVRREQSAYAERKEDPLATCVGDVNFLLQLAAGITIKSPF